MTRHLTLLLFGLLMLAGCAEEPPPRSVSEFLENPILLEAAMVRCAADRAKTRYDPECVNARQAVDRIQAKEEAEAKAALEARSESKRAALRRTQAAAAEARRRAAAARREREEAEYLAQFGVLPPGEDAPADPLERGNLPIAVMPEPESGTQTDDAYVEQPAVEPQEEVAPPEPEIADTPTDLDSIRDELRRRNEEGGG
ncbi:MAG: EexN family lipoprotein [Woeseiaceae bacterium]